MNRASSVSRSRRRSKSAASGWPTTAYAWARNRSWTGKSGGGGDQGELLNPFQCWSLLATVPLEQGDRTIIAVGADGARRSTAVSIQGTVDYCRIGEYDAHASTPGKDPGVVALAGLNHDIQSNRCHEIDGCSAPLVSRGCADDPMSCPNPFLGVVPALVNVAPTAFGKGANPRRGMETRMAQVQPAAESRDVRHV